MEIRGGRKTWIGRIAEDRVARLPGAPGHPNAQLDGPNLKPAANRRATAAQDALLELGIPEKVATRHATALKAGLAEAAELRQATGALEGWRKKAVQRSLDQFYKTLGAALDSAPVEARPAVARRSLKALAALVEELGKSAALHSAITAAVSLFDTELRLAAQGRLPLDHAQLGERFQAATEAALVVVEAQQGRRGLGTALNLLPNIVERLARRVPQLTAPELGVIVAETRRLLVEVGPRAGLDQIAASRLSRALSAALATPERGLPEVLADTARHFRGAYAEAHQALERALAEPAGKVERLVATRGLYAEMIQALTAVAQAHPTARPALHQELLGLKTSAHQHLLRLGNNAEAYAPVYRAATGLLAHLGPTPLAESVLGYCRRLVENADGMAAAAPALEAAVLAPTPGALAAQLLRAMIHPPHEGELKRALGKLAKSNVEGLLGVVLALDVQRVDQERGLELIATVERRAQQGAEVEPEAHRDYLSRLEQVVEQLEDRRYQLRAITSAQLRAIAAGVADQTRRPLSDEHADELVSLLGAVVATFPRADLTAVLGDDPETGRKGLLSTSDPSTNWKAPMSVVLGKFLKAVAKALPKAAPDLPSAIATAVDLTHLIGRLDGRYEIPYARILKDFQEAHAHPRRLTTLTTRTDPRPRTTSSVEAYLAAQPSMPRELALTAGLHLDRPRLGKLLERIEGTTGRDTVRALRDFVFACVTAERLPLFDLVLSGKLDPQLERGTIELVAGEYREDRLKKLDFDALLKGLRRGEDPVSQMQAAATTSALGKLQFEGPIDPRGMAEITSCGEAIRNLLEYTKPGMIVDDIDMGLMKAPFLAALQSIADGTWPAAKYETPLAQEILAKLSPEQQEIWRSSTLISARGDQPVGKDGPDAGPDPRLLKVRAAAKGLGKVLAEVTLRHPKLGRLNHDQAAQQALLALFNRQLEAVRAAEKGSPAHRALSTELASTRGLLALLDLELALLRLPADPRLILKKVRGPLAAAQGAIKRLGVPALTEVAADLLGLAKMGAARPSSGGAAGERVGRYAVDEDSLEALITSTTGGCVHHSEVRRWANTNLLVNPHEKMIRAYEDDEFKYRACLKLIEIKVGNYSGPALWLNETNANGNGDEEHKELVLLQALTKAKALGIPIVSSNSFEGAPRKLGLQEKERQVVVIFDDGATGSTFTDYTLPHNLREARGKDPKYKEEVGLHLVMPG